MQCKIYRKWITVRNIHNLALAGISPAKIFKLTVITVGRTRIAGVKDSDRLGAIADRGSGRVAPSMQKPADQAWCRLASNVTQTPFRRDGQRNCLKRGDDIDHLAGPDRIGR